MFIVYLLFILLLAIPLNAQFDSSKLVKAQLISEVKWIKPGDDFWVALHLQMKKDWKTYWRNPGDGGLATQLKWDLPEGFQASDIYWPYPERFVKSEMVSYGYDKEVFLLVKIIPPASLKPHTKVHLKAQAKWLVCKEVCKVGKKHLKLTLAVRNEYSFQDPKWVKHFSKARERLPQSSYKWKIHAFKQDSLLNIIAKPPAGYPHSLSKLIFCPDQEMVIENAFKPKFSRIQEGYQLSFLIAKMRQTPLTQISGVLISELDWDQEKHGKALRIDIPVNDHMQVPNFQNDKAQPTKQNILKKQKT